MGRVRSVYACTECGGQQPRWHGRCPECGAWSSLVEEAGAASPRPAAGAVGGGKAERLGAIEARATPRLATGIDELDRVLGGGLVPGAVVLLAGEPGIGKSTLLLQIAASMKAPAPILYVTGEESPEQLRLRAERLPALPEALWVLAETRVEALMEPWRERAPSLVLVDSVQTLRTDRVESAPGSVAQVRECAAALAGLAKTQGAALLLVGHVTKEGTIAGPRVLEHLVDVVLAFEGDRHHSFRLLRASKNRFGSTQEIGVFSMSGAGLEAVPNPSELFLAERRSGAPGSCIATLCEGTRTLVLEIQALVAPAGYGTARRTSLGIDDARLALLLAVLDRCGGVDLVGRDVYVNVAGGVRVAEPGADLALALALASSRLDLPVPEDVAACGELGLGGEVRRVSGLERRVKEARRLGFRRLLVPRGAPTGSQPGAQCVEVSSVAEAVDWLRANGAPHDPVTSS